MVNCKCKKSALDFEVYETSESGNSLTKIKAFSINENVVNITVNPSEKFQTITGFGSGFFLPKILS